MRLFKVAMPYLDDDALVVKDHFQITKNEDGPTVTAHSQLTWTLQSGRKKVLADLGKDRSSRKPSWFTEENAYRMECRRSRYERIDSGVEDGDNFRRREIRMSISIQNVVIAKALFVEWDSPGMVDPTSFIEEADALSYADYRLALAVARSWDMHEFPFDYGTIVSFERLTINSVADTDKRVWDLLNHAIEKEFKRRGSVLVLKAFPLEFENSVTTDAQKIAQGKRVDAMRRLYRQRLGVQTLPNDFGKEGWLWRPLRYCPEPGLIPWQEDMATRIKSQISAEL